MNPTRCLIYLLLCVPLGGTLPASSVAQLRSDSEIQVLQRLAEERYAEGHLERAAEIYQEIAEKQTDTGDRARALFTASWLIHLSGDSAAALAALTRSLRMAPDQPFEASLYNREFELLYRQALDLALKERHRESAEMTQAAVAEINSGHQTKARSLLEAAKELDSDNPSALYNLALLDLRDGATEESLPAFERVVSLTYKDDGAEMTELRARSLTSIGMIYQRQGLLDDAEQSFLEATRADSLEASAWLNLGLLRFQRGSYEAAATTLERAHELLPEESQVTRILATCLLESGRAGHASTLLETHLQRYPDDAEMWLQLGEIESRRGDPAAAIGALERSLQTDAQNQNGVAVQAAIHLSSIHLEQSNEEAALDAANQAVGWDPSNPDAWTVLGHAQLAVEQIPAAAASLGRAAELHPNSVERQMTLADALAASKQFPQAEAAYLRALTLDPNSAEASASLQTVRAQIANQRAIVTGRARPPKPISPKKVGLEFASIDYKDLQLRGALVKQVNKKSPAARAGLRKGDLILWVGDYSVLSGKDFFQYLKRSPPGDRLDLEYLRDGRIHDVELQLR